MIMLEVNDRAYRVTPRMSDVSHFRYMIPTVITRAGREYCRYLTVVTCNLFDTATEASIISTSRKSKLPDAQRFELCKGHV